MQTAPPGVSESQARDGADAAWRRRAVHRIVRSARTAEGRGRMRCILAITVHWNRWVQLANKLGEQFF